ncbi:MAG: glycosyltransferase family 1 protein, partial [Kiritimatiellae bacterium]|nr:glycosyltransferase family 1 protein [Kiritimatiellia bacterium]
MGFDAKVMWGATSKRPCRTEIEYDVVFVGNTRENGRRRIVDDMGKPNADFKVWGRGYKDLHKDCFAGQYVDYSDLAELYGSSLITLNDHRPEMIEAGFVAIRIFDILASGGFCISDANPGINEIFGDVVPQYHSSEELQEIVSYYIDHPEARQARMEQGRKIAANHTWQKLVVKFMSGIKPEMG